MMEDNFGPPGMYRLYRWINKLEKVLAFLEKRSSVHFPRSYCAMLPLHVEPLPKVHHKLYRNVCGMCVFFLHDINDIYLQICFFMFVDCCFKPYFQEIAATWGRNAHLSCIRHRSPSTCAGCCTMPEAQVQGTMLNSCSTFQPRLQKAGASEWILDAFLQCSQKCHRCHTCHTLLLSHWFKYSLSVASGVPPPKFKTMFFRPIAPFRLIHALNLKGGNFYVHVGRVKRILALKHTKPCIDLSRLQRYRHARWPKLGPNARDVTKFYWHALVLFALVGSKSKRKLEMDLATWKTAKKPSQIQQRKSPLCLTMLSETITPSALSTWANFW